MAGSTASATTRAWTHVRRGNPADVLTLNTLPRPEAASLLADEILVRVSHVGIFQGVAMLMAILPHFNSKPWIPCSDFSGTIVAVGSDINHVKPGDEVFGSPDPKRYLKDKYNGLLTEYAVLPGTAAVKKPASITMAAAAGVGGNGSTAIQLCEQVSLKRGQKVLVTAASSSTGSLTVQVARWCVGKEGTVVGTCSAANEALVKGIGVDEVIDYRRHPRINEYLSKYHSSEPFDAIIDIAGSDDLFAHCPDYLKLDGTFIHAGNIGLAHGSEPSVLNILGWVFRNVFRSRWPSLLGGTPRRNFFYSANISLDSLQELSKLIEEGHVKGLVDSEWPMEDAIKAFQRVKTARARGKVIVQVSA